MKRRQGTLAAPRVAWWRQYGHLSQCDDGGLPSVRNNDAALSEPSERRRGRAVGDGRVLSADGSYAATANIQARYTAWQRALSVKRQLV